MGASRSRCVDHGLAAIVALILVGVVATGPSAQEDQQLSPALDRLDQRDLPLDGQYRFTSDGDGVLIYVVDTGVDPDHEEVAGRVVSGVDLVDDGAEPADCAAHGTAVAGIAAGATLGVAPAASIVDVRAFDCGGRSTAARVGDALRWIADEHPAEHDGVVLLAFSAADSASLDDLLVPVVARDLTVVVAAGNQGGDACSRWPASSPDVLTMAAADLDDSPWPTTNLGPCVDLFATNPGIAPLAGTPDLTDVVTGTSVTAAAGAGAVAREQSRQPIGHPTTRALFERFTALAGPVVRGLPADTTDRLLYLPPDDDPVRVVPPPSGAVVHARSVSPAAFRPTASGVAFSTRADGCVQADGPLRAQLQLPGSARLLSATVEGEGQGSMQVEVTTWRRGGPGATAQLATIEVGATLDGIDTALPPHLVLQARWEGPGSFCGLRLQYQLDGQGAQARTTVPVAPCALFDSRDTEMVEDGATIRVPVVGPSCLRSNLGVTHVSVHVVALEPSRSAVIRAPGAPAIRTQGKATSRIALIEVASDGELEFEVSGGDTHLRVVLLAAHRPIPESP